MNENELLEINADFSNAIEGMTPIAFGNVELTFFYCTLVEADAPFHTEEHQHPTYELAFHLKGASLYTNVNGTDVALSEKLDTMFLLPPCQLHHRRQLDRGPSLILSICFGITGCTKSGEAACQQLNECILEKGCSLAMRPFYHQLVGQLIRKQPCSIFSSTALQGLLLSLISTILSENFPGVTMQTTLQDKLWPQSIEQSLAYTLCNRLGTRQVSLADLSRMYHLSARQLNRKFKQHYGRSVMEYQRELRLKNAKALLSSTTKSITEIAYTFRFRSLQLFTRFFKKYAGVSPTEYRLAESRKAKRK